MLILGIINGIAGTIILPKAYHAYQNKMAYKKANAVRDSILASFSKDLGPFVPPVNEENV